VKISNFLILLAIHPEMIRNPSITRLFRGVRCSKFPSFVILFGKSLFKPASTPAF
jgi:hypothetical protein